MARVIHKYAATQRSKDFRKSISNQVAFALITYTMLLIFMVTPVIKGSDMSILPYFLLVVFVGLMVPFCCAIERRWKKLSGSELSNSGLSKRYSVDCAKLWLVAIGIPAVVAVTLG